MRTNPAIVVITCSVGVIVACTGTPAEPVVTRSELSRPVHIAPMPAEVSAWTPEDLPTRWRGSWFAHVKSHDGWDLDPIAVDLAASGTAFDSHAEHAFHLEIDRPCGARVTVDGVEDGLAIEFVVSRGELRIGIGSMGYRDGAAAVVCTKWPNVYVLDKGGRCTSWHRERGAWSGVPASCKWSVVDGSEVLEITETTRTATASPWSYTLRAEGNLLLDDDARTGRLPPLYQRVDSAAAARHAVATELAARSADSLR